MPGETPVAIAAGVPLTEENQFHVCLRVTQAMAAVLLDAGVALLHAGLAEIAGRRVLLAGASGAGKTTAGRRLPTPWRSLSDDATQVLFDERGAACAAPWPTISRITSGACSERWACNDVAPLAAIFYLRHSAADELRRMGGAEAAGNLYVSMRQFCAVRLAVRTARPWMVAPSDLFTAAQRVAKAVPTYELGHARWGRFWELIESAIDGAPPAESATGGAGRARET